MPVTGLGYWTWNLPAGTVTLSPEAQRIFGEGSLDGSIASWLRSVDAADAKALQDIEDQVRNGQRTFSFEYRFTGRDGLQRWLKSDGEVVSVDDHGTPVTLAGTVIELDDRQGGGPRPRRNDAPARLDAVDAWIWEQDPSYRLTSLSGESQEAIPELAGTFGRRRWELPHAVPLNTSWQQHIEALERREPFRGFEYRIGDGPDASYVSTSGDPVYDDAGDYRGYAGTARNITRRVKAEQAATQARVLLRQASRLGQLGAWALRFPDMDLEWTDESRRIFGLPADAQPTWEQMLAHFEEPHRAELQQAVADCIARQTTFSLEARAVTRQGRTAWLRIIGEPEPSFTGPCRRVIGAIQDISARKEDARRLQEVNETLVTTLESITGGFYTLDRQWRFTYVNHETERVTKRPRNELLGVSIFALFPWFAGSRFHQEFERALSECRTVHFEACSEALDVWVEVYAYPSSQGLTIYFQDITERKNAQQALKASEERHRLLFEVSLDAIFQLEEMSGTILSANPAACQMFGLTEAQLRERGRAGLVAPEERRLEPLLRQIRTTGTNRGPLTMVRGDGTRFEADVSGAMFKASDGNQYSSVVVRDTSQLVKYQAQILALNESLAHKVRERTAELEAANAELKAFAHSLAHDLRTPIAAINAFGHALEARLGASAGPEREYAAKIQQAGQQLDDYVEALLSHARISQAPIRQSRVDLSAMAEDILADLRLRDPGRTVLTEVQPGLLVSGDGTLLRMALENLLGNAWKFSSRRAAAQIRLTREQESAGSITFCVSDNGAGFDMEYAHRLFGTFQRLHTESEFPGTGIGLANVQRIVSRHGGRIRAVGRKDAGASFHVTLPKQPASAAQVPGESG